MTSGKFRRLPTTGFFIVVLFAIAAAFFPAGPAPAGGPSQYGDKLPAKGRFLVANSTIADPRFRQTVILIIGSSEKGATGLIINRPTKLLLADALAVVVPGLETRTDTIYYGGPLESRRLFLLIRSEQKPEDSDAVYPGVYVSESTNTLRQMLDARKTQKQFRVYGGYAGWLPGQLDAEMSRGDWYVLDADEDFIFEKKESEVWPELFARCNSIQVNRAFGRIARN